MVQCKTKNRAFVELSSRRAVGKNISDLENGRVECVPSTTLHMVVVLTTATDHLERSAAIETVPVENIKAIDLVR